MNTPNPNFFTAFTADLVWIVLAMVGGIAKYLDTYVRTGNAPKIGLLVAHALVSGFSGYMVAQVALKIQPDWALVAAGVGGYLGTQGMDFISELLRRRLNIISDRTANEGETNKPAAKKDD
jgi:hypothetical protein